MNMSHLYQRVTTSWVYPLTGTLKALAKPKSASLISPFEFTSKFCGFKSLNIMSVFEVQKISILK